ncbi:MAG: prolipoprotein diacylglyceryl transferase, partial [Acidimicrobiales bacterium]
GIAGGVITGAIGARRANLRLGALLDCAAPAFALAQAIGRWGTYFNQELYGRPSSLPWAVKIDHPNGYAAGTTFQPTFLYESIWDLIVVGLLIWTEKKLHVRRGYLIAWYTAYYTFGRFFIEYLRIDPAHKYLGLRLNDWTSVLIFAAAAVVIVVRGKARPGDELAGAPLADQRHRAPRPTSTATGELTDASGTLGDTTPRDTTLGDTVPGDVPASDTVPDPAGEPAPPL